MAGPMMPPMPPAPPAAAPPRMMRGGGPGNPQQALMSGLLQIKKGVELVVAVLPGLAPVLMDFVGKLETMVPQALVELTQGGSSLPPGGGPIPGPPAAGAAGPPMPR